LVHILWRPFFYSCNNLFIFFRQITQCKKSMQRCRKQWIVKM
jgi:hypothetical protein